jgi:hypothetical protein
MMMTFFLIQKGIKNAEFHNDLKSVEKVVKTCTNKDVTEICTFSIFTHVRQIGVCVFFKNFFSTDLKSA